jgi:hypothetical protein
MAKRPAPKAPAKKATKAATPAIKPVKQAMTKSALINLIAEENEIPRKTAVGVYKTIENAFLGSVHPRGLGRRRRTRRSDSSSLISSSCKRWTRGAAGFMRYLIGKGLADTSP